MGVEEILYSFKKLKCFLIKADFKSIDQIIVVKFHLRKCFKLIILFFEALIVFQNRSEKVIGYLSHLNQ